MSLSHRLLLVTSLALCALTAPASAASIWTQVPADRFSPPTTAAITAIEYQAADRFWLTTSDGAIYTRDASGTFVRRRSPTAVPLNDIEFLPGSGIGLAVGNGGQVLRSVDAGLTWTDGNPAGTPIPVSENGDSTFMNCRVTEPLGDAYSVRFAGAGRAWVFGPGSQIARSQPASAANVGAAGSWVDANRDTKGTATPDDDGCRMNSAYNEGYADGFFPPSNPDVGYIIAGSYSEVFFTSNNLAGTAPIKPAAAGNAGSVRRNVAGDPENPGRMWATAPEAYGRSTTAYTQDGWATAGSWQIGNPSTREFAGTGPWDVDFAGGTVLAAGDAGMVLNSIDGATFYYNDADGSLATQDWRSASLASASEGAIGGINGKLALTTQANTVPDLIAPTGTIAGPATAESGKPVTFTAQLADETGGSGIDASSVQWTAQGLPGQTGNPATFTFPQAGSYTIKVTFRDNAGNAGNATKSVSVKAPPAPQPTVRSPFGFPPKPGTARRRGKRVHLGAKGLLSIPAGLTAAQACSGPLTIRWYKPKRKKPVASTTLSLTSTCSFKRTIKIKRKKIGKARRVGLRLSFAGNPSVAPSTRMYTVKVK